MKSYEALSARVHASLTLIHTSSIGKLQVLKCLATWPHSCTCIVRAIYSPVSFGHLPELFNNHLWSQEETISRVKLGCMPSSKGASFALSSVGTAQRDLLTKHLISAAKAEELLGKLWHTYRGRTRSSGPQATRRWQEPGALAVES